MTQSPTLAGLWQRHRNTNLERVAILESVAAAALRGGLGPDWRESGQAAAHKLAGSLGTFGLARGSELAFLVEAAFRDHTEDPGVLATQVTELRTVIEDFGGPDPEPGAPALGTHTRAGDTAVPSQDRDQDQDQDQDQDRSPKDGGGVGLVAGGESLLADPGAEGARQVVILADDQKLRTSLGVAGARSGWRVEVTDNLADTLTMAESGELGLAIVDLPDAALVGGGSSHALVPLQHAVPSAPVTALATAVPTVILVGRDTLAHRISAARAGAIACLERRVAPGMVMGFAARLMAEQLAPVIRVLGLCPNSRMRRDLSALLGEGFELNWLSEVKEIMPTVRGTCPDVLLVSMGLAEIDGMTICRVLRGDPETHRIPLIALAPSPDRATFAAAVAAGVDDIVTKGMAQAELGHRIRIQAKRGKRWIQTDDAGALVALPASETSRGAPSPPTALHESQEPDPDSDARETTSPESPLDQVDVLVVEDDESVGDVIEYALGFRGLTIRRINNGLEAATLLCDRVIQPRLVILDVGLPGLDGFGVLSRLRDAGRLSTTPVIVLTARSSEAETLAALGLGATEHMAKPFSVPILVKRVEWVLSRAGQK